VKLTNNSSRFFVEESCGPVKNGRPLRHGHAFMRQTRGHRSETGASQTEKLIDTTWALLRRDSRRRTGDRTLAVVVVVVSAAADALVVVFSCP